MKICYIILTCENYLASRVKFLLDTCLKNIDSKDIYFLSCKPIEPNIYGWNTADNYESCTLKYVRFFQNMKLDYDWYYFMDDDTFVFPDRLNKFVINYNKNESLYIGHRCENYSFPIYMSGGAGFLLTKSLYLSLLEYIRNTPENELLTSIYGDYLIGLWLTNINKEIINVEVLNPQTHKNDAELKHCISFHYLKTKEQYYFYNNLIEQIQ
jgi:hypothetical protein